MELVVGISATIIALCAMGVSIMNTVYMRQHNKRSVTPLLDLDMRKVTSKRDGKLYHCVCLKSTGIGPAIIKSFDLSYAGFDIADPRSIEELKKDAKAFTSSNPNNMPTFLTVLKRDEVLAAGDTEIIFGISFEDTGLRTFDFLRLMCDKTECSIVFESVYGDRKTVTLDAAKEAYLRKRNDAQ